MKGKLETRLCSHKARSMPLGEEKVHREEGYLLTPFRYFTVEEGDGRLPLLVQRSRQESNKFWWVDAKKRKKGAPRREMLLLCFLSALDVRLKVVTLFCDS